MITSIRLVNFKNFADETLRLGPVTILVGANASGKSNVRDAFRILQGIDRGYTLAEIFGGKREAGWLPIRGAMNEIIRFGQSTFSLEAESDLEGKKFRYMIEIGYATKATFAAQWDGPFRVEKERVEADSKVVYHAGRDATGTLRITESDMEFEETAPDSALERPILNALSSRRGDLSPAMSNVFQMTCRALGGLGTIRFLDPVPDRMREPASPGATSMGDGGENLSTAFPRAIIMGDGGENLSTALQGICADPKRRETLTSWLHELTPMDVTGFEFPRDPGGRVHLVICEKNGRKVSAASASDGTLRFLALLVALFDRYDAGLFFDELDTGIHPVRLGLLLDLFEGPARGDRQIIGTTHAPTLLTAMNDETFEHSSVVCRLEDADDAIIRPLAAFPNVRDLRQDQGLGPLHESGWMEDMLAFGEGNDAGDGE